MAAIPSSAKHRPLATFYLLTFALSWIIWIAMAATSLGIDTAPGRALNVVAGYGPTVAALVLTALYHREAGLRKMLGRLAHWRVSPVWFIVALFMLPATMLLAIAIMAATGERWPPMAAPGPLAALMATEFVRVLFLGGPLGEELGWRGYALPALLARRSPFSAGVLLGIVWGLWHAPLYFVPGTGQFEFAQGSGSFPVPFLGFLTWTIGLSILYTWLLLNTGGSLLIVVLFHTSTNLASFLPFALGMPGSAAPLLNVLLTWALALVVSRAAVFRRPSPEREFGDAAIS